MRNECISILQIRLNPLKPAGLLVGSRTLAPRQYPIEQVPPPPPMSPAKSHWKKGPPPISPPMSPANIPTPMPPAKFRWTLIMCPANAPPPPHTRQCPPAYIPLEKQYPSMSHRTISPVNISPWQYPLVNISPWQYPPPMPPTQMSPCLYPSGHYPRQCLTGQYSPVNIYLLDNIPSQYIPSTISPVNISPRQYPQSIYPLDNIPQDSHPEYTAVLSSSIFQATFS